MRILFDFDGCYHVGVDEKEMEEINNISFWIGDFPSKINAGDLLDLSIISDERIIQLLDDFTLTVGEVWFKKDKEGIYQHAYLDIS